MKPLGIGFLLFHTLVLHGFAEVREIPILLDQKPIPRNLSGDETTLGDYMMVNWNVLQLMPLNLSQHEQDQISARMADSKLPWELRVLYTVVLANQGHKAARQFLVEQYKTAGDVRIPQVMQAIYWTWRMPWLDERREEKVPTPDMQWAEEIMLSALADKRLCRIDTPMSGEFAIRDLAIHFGSFQAILSDKKPKKALPVLTNLVIESLNLAPEEDLFATAFQNSDAGHVVISLAEWEDAAVEPVMLEVVRSAVRKSADEWALADAIIWLVERKNQEVIEIVREGLDLDYVFSSLIGTKHEHYLKVIRTKLEDLQDDGLVDFALYRQQHAKANAELILIMGENADPVPKLMEFASNVANLARGDAIVELKVLKDPRCVVWAENMAAVEQDWFVPFRLIELLGEMPGNDATMALVNLLDAPFDKITPTAGISYTSRDYHECIRETLEKRTGQKLGLDPAAWREWLDGPGRAQFDAPFSKKSASTLRALAVGKNQSRRAILLHAFLRHPGAGSRALAGFELGVRLADDIQRALAFHDLAIGVAALGGVEGRKDFHGGWRRMVGGLAAGSGLHRCLRSGRET
jgi:hypothetical protein